MLERLADVPDPRDPRGRHRLAVVLALTACAVLAGATSLLAVGEWIADAPGYVLEQVGADPDPLLPRRVLPVETTVRRLLARIDGDALDLAVGSWHRRTADRRPPTADRRPGCAVSQWTARACAAWPRRRAARSTCSPHWSTPAAWFWPQLAVGEKTNEITCFQLLLDSRRRPGRRRGHQ
ncbi:transposase family protein [Streptomyces sp. NPDC002838]|uniref:transposase family protein n=1 Tax=Streptomyces sp. NPDC002838 TaxID=3154436 RepID=UPI003327F8EF